MLAANSNKEIIAINVVEEAMLSLPQVECPVVHHFGPGIYMREVTIPAGSFALGHAQKQEHLNIVLSGKVAMIGDDGAINIVQAPYTYTGKPGRKIGYVIETIVWLNIYSTSETDIDKLEEMLLDKSQTWEDLAAAQAVFLNAACEEDREDYDLVLSEYGFTEDIARSQSENLLDYIPMPDGFISKISVRKSPIEGVGIFANYPFIKGDIIAPARIGGMRTPAGRFTNHSKSPNAIFVKNDIGDIYLTADRNISGCKGGDNGEEITVDYRQALSLSGVMPLNA